MAGTDKVRFKGKQPLELPIDENKDFFYNEVDTVSICCLIDAIVKVTGTVTGNTYIFHGAGSLVDVDIRDKDEILNKKRGRACCGGISGASLFQLA